jgi:hypothetical protein
MLRGKAIECVSLIGLAVGAEKVSWLVVLRSKDLMILNKVSVPHIAGSSGAVLHFYLFGSCMSIRTSYCAVLNNAFI